MHGTTHPRYEVRDETVKGVEVAGLYWVDQAGARSLVIRFARDAVPLLADAVAAYLAGNPAGQGDTPGIGV